MVKYLLFITIILSLTACQKEARVETPAKMQARPPDTPQIIRAQAAYQTTLNGWGAFKNLETQMQRFQQAQPPEYPLILEDLLRLQRELVSSPIPETFNTPAVKSRITVVKTYLLKTQWLQNETNASSNTLLQQKNELINAFNDLKKQLIQAIENETAQQFLKNVEP